MILLALQHRNSRCQHEHSQVLGGGTAASPKIVRDKPNVALLAQKVKYSRSIEQLEILTSQARMNATRHMDCDQDHPIAAPEPGTVRAPLGGAKLRSAIPRNSTECARAIRAHLRFFRPPYPFMVDASLGLPDRGVS